MRHGRQPADAADLTQEVMLKLLSKISRSSESYRNLSGLALCLTRDALYADVHRRARWPVCSLDEVIASGNGPAASDEACLIWCVFADLAPRLGSTARALFECMLDGNGIAEAAKRLGISSRAAYVLRRELILALQS